MIYGMYYKTCQEITHLLQIAPEFYAIINSLALGRSECD